ncbi:sigma-70 family RNA polymerase sigma factor [Blastococcus sp. MG754426]|uniref:sigma-70 family RNA polymerase sigma factor n=1 Tax=unclassified Blastococcus TaxID=2619396 RepID=UPI001EF05ACD|nr:MULTISPECIES: sigma-70 family RNA polymerase sigma factor [unclassified Blastococcus]MCF6507022.1 sigma-70 family RNA polymerase sigma factor [Blastococcus sp. MG754426]MCF6511687.1 sigma-70 family RNA polymerase sigma factor [Blastococcus sp. MG754427]MCF6735514.1 sigma-70 family RNA polymerase sigma factor [Blastococcus sp. KM273129]
MPAAGPAGSAEERPGSVEITALVPLVRRIVASRVRDAATVDDLVQETLARVLAAAGRIEPGMLEPYAIVTARNVVTSLWREQDRQRRNQHRVVDLHPSEAPDADVLAREDRDAVSAALRRLGERERATLLAHEVAGQDTRSLAAELGSTAGAVAAQLNRTRARLRVEYLLALEATDPPTDRCRPVLLALSSGDRRRQREVDAARHLLECGFCAGLSQPLVDRGRSRDDEIHVAVRADADVVAARQAAREAGARLGFPPTDLTAIATAVSEVTRNVVKFAEAGEAVIELLEEPRRGIRVVVRDVGPGIPDVAQALQDGFSTYAGLGLGLPGARRLMDEFTVVSEVGRGTTVTMTKWWGER